MMLQAITLDDGSVLSYFVCDFPDAFFAVPLNPQERCYFATQYMGYTYVWNRVAQGSLDGPTLYGRVAALVARLTQSILDANVARCQLYIDDPIITICASPQYTERLISVVCLAWLVIGFGLSFHKAQRGHTVEWVGYQLTASSGTVRIQMK